MKTTLRTAFIIGLLSTAPAIFSSSASEAVIDSTLIALSTSAAIKSRLETSLGTVIAKDFMLNTSLADDLTTHDFLPIQEIINKIESAFKAYSDTQPAGTAMLIKKWKKAFIEAFFIENRRAIDYLKSKKIL